MRLIVHNAARGAALSALLLSLAACVSVPTPSPPDDVELRTDLQKPTLPSINASVLTDASVLDYSFAASIDPNVRTMTRLESSYTLKLSDDENERLRLGDTVSTSGTWGSTVRYGGVQFGTRFTPNSDVLYSDNLAQSGVAVLPTAADALFASISDHENVLSRQSLSINTPQFNDHNAINIVANDAFGRSEAITAPLVAGARLVESGCKDFSVGFGKVRRDFALTSNDYGPLFANTTIACAAPLGFTIEGHGEYLAEQVAALGIGLARKIGPIGTASLAFASSETEIGSGWLARVGFERQGSLVNLAVRTRVQSREFREVGTVWVEDPIMRRNLASVGLNISDAATVALAYAAQTTWERERADIFSLNQKMTVGRGSIVVSAGHSLEDDIGSSFFLSYKRPFGSPARRARFDESDLELMEVAVGRKDLSSGG